MLGKISAIFAIISFLSIQFVHAAVLDAADAHADIGSHHHIDFHHHYGMHDHDDHDDDESHDSLHSALHNICHVACEPAFVPAIASVPTGDRFMIRDQRDHGRSLRPPVPPPLA